MVRVFFHNLRSLLKMLPCTAVRPFAARIASGTDSSWQFLLVYGRTKTLCQILSGTELHFLNRDRRSRPI